MAKILFPLVAGAIPTSILSSFNATTSNTITLASMDHIPEEVNHITIRDSSNHFVTVEFAHRDGNVLSGITYVEGDANYTFIVGSKAVRTFDKYDYDALISNIEENRAALDNKLDVQYTEGEDGFVARVDPCDHKLKVMRSSTRTVGFAEIRGEPFDNEKLEDLFESKVDIDQGEENYNKYLYINEEGKVVPNEGTAGTIDYEDVINKPTINDVTLVGDLSSEDLGLANADDLDKFIEKTTNSLAFKIGRDSSGLYVEF